jgi:hypothetical protein
MAHLHLTLLQMGDCVLVFVLIYACGTAGIICFYWVPVTAVNNSTGR